MAALQLNQLSFVEKRKFPLLKLPRVVLLECIENLDLLEIIIFSLLSKRAKTIIKLIRWSPMDITIQQAASKSNKQPQIRIRFSNNPGSSWLIVFYKQTKSSKYPYCRSYLTGPKVYHYFTVIDDGNAIEDLKKMAEHICEVLRKTIHEVNIFEESLIDWILKFQPIIRYIWIKKDVITSVETLDRIFKNLEVTERFASEPVAIDINIQYTQPIPFSSISIDNSYWVTLPSILNGTNSIIRLNEPKLTPMDINTIFKEWQLGTKLYNLKYLEIRTSALENPNSFAAELFDGLNLKKSEGDDGRPKTFETYEKTYTLPDEAAVFNLIRSDGMIGSISFCYTVGGDPNSIHAFIVLQIWRRET